MVAQEACQALQLTLAGGRDPQGVTTGSTALPQESRPVSSQCCEETEEGAQMGPGRATWVGIALWGWN